MNSLRRYPVFLVLVFASMLALPGIMPASAAEEGVGDVGGENAHAILVTTDALFEALFIDGDAVAVERIVGGRAEISMPLADGTGADALLDYVDRIKATYPGARFDITSVALDGSMAVVTWRISGEAFRIDPVEDSSPALVEGSGQLVIDFGASAQLNAVQVSYETAIAPLSSQELAGVPSVQDRPGLPY